LFIFYHIIHKLYATAFYHHTNIRQITSRPDLIYAVFIILATAWLTQKRFQWMPLQWHYCSEIKFVSC